LRYTHVAREGSSKTGPNQITAELFEQHLRYLHNAGFRSASLDEWQAATEAKTPLSSLAVIITFDHGYRSFATYAWPLLKRYGFSAVVFVVTDQVAKPHHWEGDACPAASRLDWHEISYLLHEGVEFGSHTASHRPLTALSPTQVVNEGARSRAILERRLGVPIRAISYPYGDVDPVVQHLIGACGYFFGLSTRCAPSTFNDELLALPRIEITGADNLQRFSAKLT
jgi:peptidoglycan/xylan/chitin deacetylase (PgdA/CDA1 family)